MDKQDFLQEVLSPLETAGLVAMFNDFWNAYQKQRGIEVEKPEVFTYCNGKLCSESYQAGSPLHFETYTVHALAKRRGADVTYAILRDKKEKEYVCEFSSITGQWFIIYNHETGNVFRS